MNDILSWINEFTRPEPVLMQNLFCYKYDYEFALILTNRFGGKVSIDTVSKHFVALIDGAAYDSCGIYASTYEFIIPVSEFSQFSTR